MRDRDRSRLAWAETAAKDAAGAAPVVLAVVAPTPVQGLSAAPDEYAEVLALLRGIDLGGEVEPLTTGRSRVSLETACHSISTLMMMINVYLTHTWC